MNAKRETKVWDPVVRVFHWVLVPAFFIAYFTEEDLLAPHVWAGYLVLGLVLVRLVWGVIGTKHARFSDFVRGPRAVIGYLKGMLRMHPPLYLGHNPAGGWMIMALLVSLLFASVTGIAIYGAEEHAGPMAGMLAGTSKSTEHLLEEVHEFAANLTPMLVFFHVLGVLVSSLLERENLVRAMITGRKRVESDVNMQEQSTTVKPYQLSLVAATIIALGAANFPAMGTSLAGPTSEEIKKLRDVGEIVPLQQVIDKATRMRGGHVIEAELESEHGRLTYEVEILDEHGRVWEFYFDAATGEYLEEVED